MATASHENESLVGRTFSDIERPPTVVDRYFSKHYRIRIMIIRGTGLIQTHIQWINSSVLEAPISRADSLTYRSPWTSNDIQKKEGEDLCVLTHSNRICIVTLAPSHPVLAQKKTVAAVDFGVGGANRLDNKMTGKSKRGAQWLGALSPLCTLTCEDGSKYTTYCSVKGQLIEVNEALVNSPNLVTEQPWGTGYLGIMLPALRGYEEEMSRLLTEQQYQEAIAARKLQDTAR